MFWRKVENVQYGFKELTPDVFRILLTFEVKSDLIKKILNKNSQIKNPEEILNAITELKKFHFSEDYLNLLKTAVSGAMRNISKELSRDKINIYDYHVTKDSMYTAVGDMHHCYLIIEGDYAKK